MLMSSGYIITRKFRQPFLRLRRHLHKISWDARNAQRLEDIGFPLLLGHCRRRNNPNKHGFHYKQVARKPSLVSIRWINIPP
jgi:hypothetical protein